MSLRNTIGSAEHRGDLSDENSYIRNLVQFAQYALLQFVESADFLRNEKQN